MDDKTSISGEEKIYLDLLQQLKILDLQKVAASKGLPLQPTGDILVESFAHTYLVSQDGVTANDDKPINSKQKLAVISYILSDCSGPPAFDFIPFSHLGGFNIGREQHADKNIKKPLLKRFGDDYELFTQAALKIGGTQHEETVPGKNVWLFHVFPNLIIQVIFYERDEEFPADIQVLFDSKALDYFGMKCLGFLPGYFTSALIDAASD